MRKENNVLGFLIILLSIVVLGYTAFIIYDKVINKEDKSSETTQIQISDVVGEYTAEFKDLKTDEGQEEYSSAFVKLSLYDNGIYTYVYNQYAPIGSLGNYVIKNNSIILTMWFNTGSSPQLDIVKGEKVLIINDYGSIMDKDIKSDYLKENGISIIELTKNDNKIGSFDLSNRLSAASFNENNHTINNPIF